MFAHERRFGFSVMGGSDEGFPPRIDDITEGQLRANHKHAHFYNNSGVSVCTKSLKNTLGQGIPIAFNGNNLRTV